MRGIKVKEGGDRRPRKHILPLEGPTWDEAREERQETSTWLFLRLRWMETPKSCITTVTYVSRKFSLSLSPDTFLLLHPPTYSTQPSHPHPSPRCSPRALETEWSECEPPIVEINGIWSTGYKEWQSLDSKWAKRVVRTWAVLVVRKGWREREREGDGAMEGRKEATGCLF